MCFIYYIDWSYSAVCENVKYVCHAMTIGSWFGSDLQLPSMGHKTAFVAKYDFSLSLLLWISLIITGNDSIFREPKGDAGR